MATRIVEWKKPYTWWKAIDIDENKVISLRLRDENNLIIYDAWDNEIYVDLQLPDEITPTDAFPVWITTGRVIVDNGWDVQGTIIVAKTTSGDNIKILYADDGKLYMDNGTWSFKQIYFKADVDLIVDSLQAQIDVLSGLGKFLSLWDCATGEPISFPLEIPYEYSTWDWYMINNIDNTTNYRPSWTEYDETASSTVETDWVNIWDVYIYDGTVWLLQKNAWWGWGSVTFAQILWQPTDNTNLATALNAKQDELTAWTNIQIQNNVISATWWSDIVYATQAEYNALPSSKLTDGKHYVIYKSDWWGWWQPWANTVGYYPLTSDFTDQSGNWYDLSVSNASITTLDWVSCAYYSGGRAYNSTPSVWSKRTLSTWFYNQTSWVLIGTWADQNTFQCMMLSNAWAWKIQISDFHTIWYDTSNISSNAWHHAVAVCDGANMYLYIDWVLANSWTHAQTDNSTWVSAWGKPFLDANPDTYTWYLSKVIIENAAWTAQEVADYYDQTKANYWIS